MKPTSRSRLRLLLVPPSARVVPVPASAQAQAAWPTKPVRMVVPFSPGGATDIVARAWWRRSCPRCWGQTVVVDNRAGAGGNIGADIVAKAPPDGYTLLMASGSITINPHLYKKMPFDTEKDLRADHQRRQRPDAASSCPTSRRPRTSRS